MTGFPYYPGTKAVVYNADALEMLKTLPDCSVDAVVTDPPYGLSKEPDMAEVMRHWLAGDDYVHKGNGFMGKSWDSFVPGPSVWRECLRVLKPGGHLLCFAGSRTQDLMGLSIRLAGFEIRDSIAWLYGSGFPKSLDVSKAIDKRRDEDREPMLRVRAWLNDRRVERGVSLGQINALFGLATNGGGNASNWTQHPTNIEIPSWDKWTVLKDALVLTDEMDAEVWRLNGRKGTPGEAWGQREVTGLHHSDNWSPSGQASSRGDDRRDLPATEAAQQWQGWGTALKPAFEPIVVARKPLAGTVAANVLEHGTGALNIDGCRVAHAGAADLAVSLAKNPGRSDTVTSDTYGANRPQQSVNTAGRWPTNVVLDESQAAELDQQTGVTTSGVQTKPLGRGGIWTTEQGQAPAGPQYGDSGGASRFFPVFKYQAKAPAKERPKVAGVAHPTVKPLELMRWLVRLVTPPDGVVLEPFAGSGTTVEAALLEGLHCVAIEREADYLPLIFHRIYRSTPGLGQESTA